MVRSSRRQLRAAAAATVAAAAMAAVVTVACGATQPSPAQKSAQQRYVDGVHFTATDIGQFQTDSQLVRLGNAVCDNFRAKASTQQVADVLEQRGGKNLPPQDLGAIISSAVKELCPAYSDRLNPVSQ